VKKKISRKGVSPLVATTMLVGFTVAVIGLVIVWSRGFIEERAAKEEALANTKLDCENIVFSVEDAYQQGGNLNLNIKNQASQTIDAFVLRIKGTTGSVEATEQFPAGGIKGLETQKLGGEQGIGPESFDAAALGEISSVEIIPELKAGKNKYVPCSGKLIEARVSL